MKRLPLEGVRVADLTMMWAGPFATKLLAEMGAEVLKIESPSAWDNIRTLIPQPGVAEPWNSSYYFNTYNRDKRSVTLDLAQDRGREVFLRLLAHCDVLVENYRADVLDKLGLSEAVLREARPDLVIVSMAGFGKTGSELMFGHNGAGGQLAWGDPATGLSLGYCTNGMDRHPLRQARRGVAISSLAAALVDA